VRLHLKEPEGFPRFATSDHSEDIYVSPNKDERGCPTVRIAKSADGAHFGFFYCDGARFATDRRGCEIWADWPDQNYTLEDAATYLVGPVIGFVLRLRGALPLHASAVAIEGYAIALVGGPGAGKSTTAASFAKLGYAVLSDDLAVLREESARFMVQPGYPRVNLWPDSVRTLFGSEESLSRISPTWDKRFMALAPGREGLLFERRRLPLGAIYILGERQTELSIPVIEKMEGSEALLNLVANTYVNYVIDSEMRQQEFSALSRLLTNVPVRLVQPPADPSCLRNLCEAIGTDAKKLLAASSISARRGRS
jgi:hypothetical protein